MNKQLIFALMSLITCLPSLSWAGSFVVAPQVVEEHEAAVEVDALQDVVGYQCTGESLRCAVVLEIVVQSGNDGNIRPEEVAYGLMNAGMPLVQQVVRIHRTGLYALDGDGNMITPLQAVN